jgi:hypothetical protein
MGLQAPHIEGPTFRSEAWLDDPATHQREGVLTDRNKFKVVIDGRGHKNWKGHYDRNRERKREKV